ncbi:MAG: type IX secretion system membrane protein PorP/SprF [Salibacteraceae bacterium]|jgi:type IX secretion system PorP/SprF family membrane protein|nr:type IX secretion system membrane protein PorP/SprF [Salibacteraceae bacterium]MDP4686875.1 type IX secretion system membrane protein PorP/SprF [Salibacteraceae bacterium]MDP4762748.1 type IX secretion system membrane protein PorP/SprF [Salibacteraceae bacterium]MDP4933501.1 type IX secretion system membrane protein PorP/SprF [Salibacteraceae bacterium]MDP4963891.1 type IX secretion system membrane protein PorP/SprF [Salibacteraceae bacterium]
MKKLIIITAILAFGISAKSQQLEQWTQFYLNEYVVNPATAGSDEYFNAFAQYRDQWVGMVDAPRTSYISVDGPIINKKMGIGGSIISDVVGYVRKTEFMASYAYHLKLSDKYKLSFSLSAGVAQLAVDAGKIELQRSNDIALSNNWSSVWIPDFGASTRFQAENWHVGLYVPQIANLKAQYFADYDQTSNFQNRHFYLTAGYKYDIGSSDFAVEGNFLGRYVDPLDAFDFQVRGIYKDMIWVGALYRTSLISAQDPLAVGMMAGYSFANNLTIGYSYDLPLNFSSASYSTHEVVLGIKFSKKNKKPLVGAE